MFTTTNEHEPLTAPLQQRREDYRLDVPPEDGVTCTFRFVRKFERQSYSVRFEVRDISASGLSVADYDRQLLEVVGRVVRSCELWLPNQRRPVVVNVKVLRAQQESPVNRLACMRVSGQFRGVSDMASIALRRYVAELERRQIARQRGLD